MPSRYNDWHSPEEIRAFKQVLRDNSHLRHRYENRQLYSYILFFGAILAAGIGYELYDAGVEHTLLTLAALLLGALWLTALLIHTVYLESRQGDKSKSNAVSVQS